MTFRTTLRDDSGAALIAVLALLLTVSLLAMAMASLSQLAALGTRGDADRLRSGYIAEGALNRVLWYLAADQALYGSTDPADVDYAEYEEDRYLADGVDHELDYYGTPVRYRILPGAGGVTVSGGDVNTALNQLLGVKSTGDEAVSEAVTRFAARFRDYVDSDDLLTDDGMEENDYEESDQAPLPRNSALQYREELWWLPDGARFFPPDRDGRLTLVNPLTLPVRRNARPSLYTANYALLTNLGNLDSDDARGFLKKRREFRTGREALSELADPLLWQNLRNSFATSSDGLYRIVIEEAMPENEAGSLRLDAVTATPSLSAGSDILFYDWMRY